jgi:hypothetical protein
MSHSAAIENQNIESSDIKKKKRKRLFSCLALVLRLLVQALLPGGNSSVPGMLKPITPIPMSNQPNSLLPLPVR